MTKHAWHNPLPTSALHEFGRYSAGTIMIQV